MAKKTLYFDCICGTEIAAATEDGKLSYCEFRTDDDEPSVGNIYKGKVINVLEGMQAAFIDCGLERNCYLSADDAAPYGKTGGLENLAPGQEIIVQISHPPRGTKGAKVTTCLSFVGKTIIYLPDTDFIGISNRISDEELRQSLMLAASRTKRPGEGLVIRSAAPFLKYDAFNRELETLRSIYGSVAEHFDDAPAGSLLYTDFSLPVRVIRDCIENTVDKIVIGNAEHYARITELAGLLPGADSIKTEICSSRRDMLEEYGVLEQIKDCSLPCAAVGDGAYLVIERTEALTSIDVNTGGFTGHDSLEYTVYRTNLAAAREVARQVNLRDIGGLVVVDFIDMHTKEHREAIVKELEKALSAGRAPFKVLPMSEFGLVEFTRKRTGTGFSAFTLKPCPHCGGPYDFSDEFAVILMRAEILKALDGGAEVLSARLSFDGLRAMTERPDIAENIRRIFPESAVYLIPDERRKCGELRTKAQRKDYTPPPDAVRYI